MKNSLNFLVLPDGIIALIVCLIVFGIIIFTIVMLRRHTNLFHKDEKPDDETITHEELNRVLRDVDDEETKREMEEYNKNHNAYEDKDHSENK